MARFRAARRGCSRASRRPNISFGVAPSRSEVDWGFAAHLRSFAVTLGQTSSLPQSIRDVSQALMPDNSVLQYVDEIDDGGAPPGQ
jgi:hypothetical protein